MPVVTPLSPASPGSTSGSYSFTVNRDQVIRQAMLNIGKLDENESPTAQQTSDCAFALNMLIKQWQGRGDFAAGLKVWTRKLGYLFLSGTSGKYSVGPTATGWTNSFAASTSSAAAAASATAITVVSSSGFAGGANVGVQLSSGALYWTTIASTNGNTINLSAGIPSAMPVGAKVFAYNTAAQQPINIETAVLRDNQSNDIPLRMMTVQDYDNLPSKASTQSISDPTSIYYEFQLGNSNLYTDCGAAQDVSKYIVLRYMEPVQDVLQGSDTFEYPQEWYLALAWGLSSEIAPMFNAAWTQKMDENFKRSLSIAQHKDPERVSIYFQPGAED